MPPVHHNAVFHLTINKNGFWATETIEGTVSFVPDESSQPSYSGHFTELEGDNGNRQNGTATTTTNDHLKGGDGSMLAFHADRRETWGAFRPRRLTSTLRRCLGAIDWAGHRLGRRSLGECPAVS